MTKRYITFFFVCFFLFGALSAKKQNTMLVDSLSMERNENFISVKFLLHLDAVKVKSNRALLVTPRIISDLDTVDLVSFGLYGRARHLYHMRNGGEMMTGKDELSYRKKEKPDTLVYEQVIPFESWMDSAKFVLLSKSCGCCGSVLDSVIDSVYTYLAPVEPFMPKMVYIKPTTEAVKSRSISGRAYIDFPVNKTNIDLMYRNNRAELAKIDATIEPIVHDADITVKSLSMKGFASPEASYKHNTRLARERTKSLVDYVKLLHDFSGVQIQTDYEPEDWAGLREYVEKSTLENRDAILKIIDGTQSYDAKERSIKTKYPRDYKYLYENCYPALRHSDYEIDYVIKSYSDVEEIKRVMYESPQKLSLDELYLVSHEFEVGSDEYNETFEIAVRIYPNDEVANLNAANIALTKRDLSAAERYLAKAGDSKEVIYARAAHAFLSADYEKAEKLAKEAIKAGVVKESQQILHEIERLNRKVDEFKKCTITINR